jgi:hypothetical protein
MESMSGTVSPGWRGTEILTWDVEPLYENYRDLPIHESFNWHKLIGEVTDTLGNQQSDYFLVVFRSKRLPGDTNAARIGQLDTDAYLEATRSNALLKYFAGDIDEDGRALSWCLWTDQQSARAALNGPAHREAVQAAHELYEYYTSPPERYNLHVTPEDGILFETV